MGYQSGYNAKIRVNGQVYSGAEWSVEEECGDVDVTNTEGNPGNPAGTVEGGTEAHIPGSYKVRVRIKQASFNTSENPYQAPRSLSVATYAQIQIYPAGLGGVSYDHPSVLILQSNYSGTAKLGQPLEFVGVSDGGYNEASS